MFLRSPLLPLIIFVLSFGVLPPLSHANEQMVTQCVQMMKEQTAGNTSITMRALDHGKYCQCIVDNATKSGANTEDAASTAQKCMNENARANFIPLCQKEVAPEIQKATNKALDCVCFFDKTVEQSLALVKSGKNTVTPEEEQAIALKSLELCSR